MEIVENVEVIVGTYEELTLGYRLVNASEENKVAFQTNCSFECEIFSVSRVVR